MPGDSPGDTRPASESGPPTHKASEATVVLGTQEGGLPPAPSAGRYVDDGEIARGGMSSVREVYDRLLLRRIAMKELDGRAGDVARFLEEAQITAQLDHPNIVPVYDIEQDGSGVPRRLAMKLVQGETLHEVLHRRGRGGLRGEFLEEMLHVFVKVCEAVAFAHSRGVIHRDLKPSNIMLGSYGQVYVMDWGIARLVQAANSATLPDQVRLLTADFHGEADGALCGTPPFMAPEQASGRNAEVDERTDVYGLGGLLYFMLTLQPPHSGAGVMQELSRARVGTVPPPAEVVGEGTIPPFLARIAMRALAPEKADRYPNVDAMRADVEAFLRGGGWFEQKTYPPGATIIEEGETAHAAFIITSGQCELHKTVLSEKRFIRLLGAGEVFGETAIFGSTARTASIVAATEVTLLVVTRDALEKELDRNVWLRSFVEAMAERLLDLDRRAESLEAELREARAELDALRRS